MPALYEKIGDSTMTIFTRGNTYLSALYQWTMIPHLFPAWQAADVAELMACTTQPVTGYAVVSAGVVDLDSLKVEAI